MKTEEFYYDLPENLIAQYPIEDREASRMLVLDKITGGKYNTVILRKSLII